VNDLHTAGSYLLLQDTCSATDWLLQTTFINGRISGIHSDGYERTVFWDVAPCSLEDIYGRFGALKRAIRPDDGGGK
jgi:hypothetical protein